MFRKSLVASISVACAVLSAAAPDTPNTRSNLSATDIVSKNVAARGGLQAWRAVQTLSLVGKLGAGGNQRAPLPESLSSKKSGLPTQALRPAEETYLPFVMELKRPRKLRMELQFEGQKAIQVYDGANGWKLRPFLNRRVVEPYTADEMKIASLQQDLDGPLVDYAAKGTRVELDGTEKVENRDNYKLKLTMKSGQVIDVWIDAQTFLETKIQGAPRRLDGIDHPVEIYFRDYRPANGLQIPFILETKVLPVINKASKVRVAEIPPEKTIIEKVFVNPKFDEKLFTKPDPNP